MGVQIWIFSFEKISDFLAFAPNNNIVGMGRCKGYLYSAALFLIYQNMNIIGVKFVLGRPHSITIY